MPRKAVTQQGFEPAAELVEDTPPKEEAVSTGICRQDASIYVRQSMVTFTREQKVYADPIMRKYIEDAGIKVDWDVPEAGGVDSLSPNVVNTSNPGNPTMTTSNAT